MIMLGLAGQAGVGKDSVADYLVSRYGFIKFSFSDALYREVAAAFGLADESLLRDRATKELATPLLSLGKCTERGFVASVTHLVSTVPGGPEPGYGLIATFPLSPRQILQWWGTDYRRAQNPEYWVQQAEDFVFRLRISFRYRELAPQLFVNTSVRFENEREWMHGFGLGVSGNVWHIRREAAVLANAHVSETPLPVLDGEREIFNNHTLEYLYKGIDQLLSSSAQFVRLEPPAAMVEPEPIDPE